MKKRTLWLMLFIVFLSSCESVKTDTGIGVYQEIQRIFNPSEINDLRVVVDFFDEIVCEVEGVEKNNVLEAYGKYFKRIEMSTDTNVDIRINYQKQRALYQKIDSLTFNQIWKKKSSQSKITGKFEYIILNSKGKYVKFLHELGKSKPWVKDYVERFELAGDLLPSMVWYVLRHHEQFDMTDKRIRLLIAVHYLSLNEK
ncbi:MAG: hypothetical protein AB8B69_12275 [Chitinophagales bacterium]